MKLRANRELVINLHGGYRRAAVEVAVIAATVGTSVTTARVRESTQLWFAHRDTGAPASTTYVVEHDCRLVRSAGAWRLDEVRYRCPNAFSVPITEFEDEVPIHLRPVIDATKAAVADRAEPRTRASGDLSSSPSVRPASGYDYPAMVNYAYRWYNGFNSAYPKWDDDCTNFISQCVKAGGWRTVGSWPGDSRADNSKWWNGSYVATTSYSWSAAQNWHVFALNSGRTHILGNISMLLHGDVLGYDFDHNGSKDHVQMCTSTSSSEKYMTQHSGAYKDKPLTEILNSSATNRNAWYYAHRT